MNEISDLAIIGNYTRIEYGAVVSEDTNIGNDCFIGHHTVIRPSVIIGNKSEVRSFCFIAEGARIGQNVRVMQFSNICKGCVIEDNVFIGMGVVTTNTKEISHARHYKPLSEPPYIECGTRIGAGVIIMPSVRIARNSMVQAGSLVAKNTSPNCIYRGRPATKIGEVREDERI